MTSAEDCIGLIRFPAKTPSPTTDDVCISLQPTRLRGGLTFTEPLIIPSPDAQVAPLPCGPHRFIVNSLANIVAPTPAYFPLLPPAARPVLPAPIILPEFATPDSPFDHVFLVNALGKMLSTCCGINVSDISISADSPNYTSTPVAYLLCPFRTSSTSAPSAWPPSSAKRRVGIQTP